VKPASPPLLRDLGAVIEVMGSPSSVEGKALNFRRALEDIGANFGKLRSFASEQQVDISDTLDDLISKLNTLSLGHNTLDQRVGLAQGFGEDVGVSFVFEGLQYLHDKFEEAKEPFRKYPYDKMVEALGTFETDLEVLKANVTALDPTSILGTVKSLENKQRVIEESQRLSFDSVKNTILPEVMLVVKHSGGNKVRNGQDGLPLWDRVSALEASAKGVAGKDMIGKDTFHGIYDVLGDEMGSKAQLDKLVHRLDNLERENTSLRSKVDELTTMTLRETKKASDDALSSGGMNLVLERIAILESHQGGGITMAGHTFHSALDCERFLLTKVPTSDKGNIYCDSYDRVAPVHGVDKDDSGKSLESVLLRDHHATKGGFSNIGAVINYASMQQSVPGPLAGSADFPLPGAKWFDMYDKQDGLRGLRNIISRGVESKVSSLLSAMNRELQALPDAMTVFRQLLLDGSSHWRALSAYLSERRNSCFHQCADEDEA
jgi:hypothetical protein